MSTEIHKIMTLLRKFLLMGINIFVISFSYAQRITTVFVQDSVTGTPLRYATVEYDRTVKIADSSGIVKINIKDNQKIIVTYVGYEKFTSPLHNKNIETLHIKMIPSTSVLKEAVVVGQKNSTDFLLDRVVLNIDKSSQDKFINEALRRVPGVVSTPDQLVINQSSKIKIMIDGRISNLSVKDINNLPAMNYSKIEIITAPSSRFDPESVDVVLNLISVPKINHYNGSYYSRLGTRTSLVGTSVLYNKKKWQSSGFLTGSYDRLFLGSSNNRIPLISNINRVIQNNTWSTENPNIVANLQTVYAVDQNSKFGISLKASSGLLSNKFQQDILTEKENIYNTVLTKNLENNFQSLFTYSLQKNSFNCEISLQSIIQNNTLSLYSPADLLHLKQENKVNQNELGFQVDCTKELVKLIKFEFGIKYLNRQFNSEDFDFVVLDYRQQVLSSYLSFRKQWTKTLLIQLGNRHDITINDAFVSRYVYNNILPTLLISNQINKSDRLSLSFRSSIQRPSVRLLNPFINKTDPYNYFQGSPDLQPEFIYAGSLRWLHRKGKYSIESFVSFRYIQNLIESYRTIDSTIAYIKYGNLGKSITYQSGFNLSVNPFKGFYTNLSSSIGYVNINSNFYGIRKGLITDFSTNFDLQLNKMWSISGYLNYSPNLIQSQSVTSHNYFNSFDLRYNAGKNRFGFSVDNLFFNRNTEFFQINDRSFSIDGNRYFNGRAISISFLHRFGKELKQKVELKEVNRTDLKQIEKSID
jgi:ferric enterobactin receptor